MNEEIINKYNIVHLYNIKLNDMNNVNKVLLYAKLRNMDMTIENNFLCINGDSSFPHLFKLNILSKEETDIIYFLVDKYCNYSKVFENYLFTNEHDILGFINWHNNKYELQLCV
jgi:hypothetical protein